MKLFTQTQIAKSLEDLTGEVADYIEKCEKLPSKYECYECGRNSKEYFTCGCERPRVDEYVKCPVCGEWIEVDEPVWTCCFASNIICSSEVELLGKLLGQSRKQKPVNRSLGDVMIDVMCDSVEDEDKLKEATDFVNGCLICKRLLN